MNFADMLSYADIHQLTRIAQHYQCECNENSKNELIQSILSTVSRKDIFEDHVTRLNIEDLRFLNSILFDHRETLSLEELVAYVQQTKFDLPDAVLSSNPRDTIVKFKYLGWLFNGFSQQTRYLFQVPLDLKDRFRSVLERKFQSELHYTSEPPVYRDEQMLIVEDLHLLLKFVHNHTIPLNGEGVMYRRSQQQLLEGLSVTESLVGKGGWRFGYGLRFKEYPNRMSFLYDYAIYQGLLEEREERLILTSAGQDMLALGKKELLTNMYRFWLRLYKNAIPNLLSLVHWIESCTREWVTLQSLQQVIGPFIKPFYYDDAASIMEQRILRMMMHLGLLRFGEDEQNGQMVQMTTMGRAVVQGVYVPHEDKIVLPSHL
ncbi:hypothetical protein ACFQZR_17655 [Paenibacillus sp. GCM10027629]|uniref:hypothetical protein n=1 Tax=Paenibacillus sp. GCM10027629 TaxID=3273414 RepID=UPI00363BEBCA